MDPSSQIPLAGTCATASNRPDATEVVQWLLELAIAHELAWTPLATYEREWQSVANHDRRPGDAILQEGSVARIRRACPQGPYMVTGWSFGAVVAYEMARQLEAAGHAVSQLALLDPPAPFDRAGDAPALAAQIGMLLPHHPRDLISAAVVATVDLPPQARLHALTERLRLGTVASGEESQFAAHRLGIVLRDHAALAGWQPTGSVGSMLLIFSGDPGDRDRDELARWHQLCRGG